MVTASELLSTKYPSAEISEPFSHLIGKLIKSNDLDGVLFNNKKYTGMFWHYSLLRSRINIKSRKLASLITNAPSLNPDDDLLVIANLMYESNLTMLPVLSKNKLKGVVHIRDVLLQLSALPDAHEAKVSDYMQPDPIGVLENDRIGKAIQTMHTEHVDRLPVVNRKGNIVGFLSYADLLEKYYIFPQEQNFGQRPRQTSRAFAAELDDMLALPVSNFMNAIRLYTAIPENTIAEAAQNMVNSGTYSLVIIENNAPRSIITKRDILRSVLEPVQIPSSNIRYVGLDKLHIAQGKLQHIQQFCEQKLMDIENILHNVGQITLHLKEYSKTPKTRHKYSVHLRLNFPGVSILADREYGWDAFRAVHDAFDDLFMQLEDRLRKKSKNHRSVREQSPSRVVT